jgi:Skp family chaperone for outer membrane proteins
MTRVINEIGTKGAYSSILEARTALYYPKSADITAQVIAAYDKLHP